MSTVDIGQAEAVVIARAVDGIVRQFPDWPSERTDIVREHVVDGLVALVSEGWQLIQPGSTPDAERGSS